MDRSSFSSGKKTWIIACARCQKFKGFCHCTAANIIVTNVSDAPIDAFGAENPNWVAEMLARPRRESIGLAVTNSEGVTRSTFSLSNSIGISEGVIPPKDQDNE